MLVSLLGAIALSSLVVATPPTSAAPHGWEGALTLRACAAAPLRLPAETEQALHATLLVHTKAGEGSAVLISPDGFALTAAHVIANHTKVTVLVDSGDSFSADVVRVDQTRDVALLKIAALGSTPCLRPVDELPGAGTDIFVLGSPSGQELSFSVAKGIVSGHREFRGQRFVQLDASVNPGNSGGPVLDASGAVLGIMSWKISHVAVEGIAFAVPVEVALAALGILFGDASDVDWTARRGRKIERSAATTRPPPYVPSREAQRRAAVSEGFITSGAIVLPTGASAFAIAGGILWGLDDLDPGPRRSLVVTAAVGGALGGVGAALLTAGLIVRRRPRRGRSNPPSTEATAQFGVGSGLFVTGRF